jgi:hypothetical protein
LFTSFISQTLNFSTPDVANAFFSLGEEVLRARGGDHGGAQQEEGGEGEDGRGTVLFIFKKCLQLDERFSAVRSGVLFKC